MSHETLDRLSGLALIAALLFSLTGGMLHPIYVLLACREVGEPSKVSAPSGPEAAGEPLA